MTNVLDYRLYDVMLCSIQGRVSNEKKGKLKYSNSDVCMLFFVTFVLVQDANSSLKKAFQICIILRKFSVTVLKQKCY